MAITIPKPDMAKVELYKRLQDAGLPIVSMTDGVPRFEKQRTPDDRLDDDDLTPEQRVIADGLIAQYNAGNFDYIDARILEYNQIGIANELDMLWHAIDQGIPLNQSEFYTKIKAVKDKYPKP